MTKERILKEAVFVPNAVKYKVLVMALGFVASIIGIPLLLFAVPIAAWYWGRYYSRLRVILTARDLKVHRGILITEEKSIPLEKITDLAISQGPIMRKLGLKEIRVETAGQSSGQRALVSVIGIEDTDGFRDQVLNQRDRIADADAEEGASRQATTVTGALPGSPDPEILATLRSVDETLKRIERALSRSPDSPVV